MQYNSNPMKVEEKLFGEKKTTHKKIPWTNPGWCSTPKRKKKKNHFLGQIIDSAVILETVVCWSGGRKGRRFTEEIFILTVFTYSAHVNLTSLGVIQSVCMPPEKCMALLFPVEGPVGVCPPFSWGRMHQVCK